MANRQKKVLLGRKGHRRDPVEKEIDSPICVAQIDLKKEYSRFCKLYSSEPLDIVATPLERASYERDIITVDLRSRGLRGVDCIALGKIFASEVAVTHLNLSDCLLMPQGLQVLLDGICKNSKLKVLQLRGNNIGSNMVVALGKLLKQNNTLRELLLEWNCLGDSKECFKIFSEGLSVNTGLEVLDMRNNQMNHEIAIELANGLKYNKSLREIDIRWNSIGLIGAKALWDSLRINTTLSKMFLCGNFIPEDIVLYMEQCLSERQQRDALIEESNKMSTVLNHQLVKKEEEYEHELNSMIRIFNEEEASYKEAIRAGCEEIADLRAQVLEKTQKNDIFVDDMNILTFSMQSALNREETLRNALKFKENEIVETRHSLKLEMHCLNQEYEVKLNALNNEIALKMKELENANTKVRDLEMEMSHKDSLIVDLNERLSKMKETLQKSDSFFEERIQSEKEKWASWKVEVETAEREEITMLENQIKEIQQSMMSHIHVIEAGKREAEEEIRKLKMNLIVARSEAEDNLVKVRNSVKEENDSVLNDLFAQIEKVRSNSDELETKLRKSEIQLRTVQSENDRLCKETETLRMDNEWMTQKLETKDTDTLSALTVAQTDAKESADVLKKEMDTNEALKKEILNIEEQLAELTIKNTREVQERLAEVQKWKSLIERKNAELARIKEDEFKRATLLQDAFLAYMESSASAAGVSLVPFLTSNVASEGLEANAEELENGKKTDVQN